jgi:hypothetical protein
VALSTRSSLASLPAMLQGRGRPAHSPARCRCRATASGSAVPGNRAGDEHRRRALRCALAGGGDQRHGLCRRHRGRGNGVARRGQPAGQISFVTSIAPISIALGVPIEPLALLLALETIPDTFRTLGNVVLDVAVTGVVSEREEGAGRAA